MERKNKIKQHRNKRNYSTSITSNSPEVDPETIGQYTTLKDKNKKEIYKGDIFNLGDNRILYIVEWFDTGLSGRQNGNSSRVGLQYWQDKIEVIGNIYDNPELLKEE